MNTHEFYRNRHKIYTFVSKNEVKKVQKRVGKEHVAYKTICYKVCTTKHIQCILQYIQYIQCTKVYRGNKLKKLIMLK